MQFLPLPFVLCDHLIFLSDVAFQLLQDGLILVPSDLRDLSLHAFGLALIEAVLEFTV